MAVVGGRHADHDVLEIVVSVGSGQILEADQQLNDTITGGPGADTIDATRSKVTLHDSVDDMAGDTIFAFHSSTRWF